MFDDSGAVLGASDERQHGTGPVEETIDPPLRDRAAQYYAALQGARPRTLPFEVDSVRTCGDHVEIVERLYVRPMDWGLCVTIVDQTEARQLQTTDIQSARLAALGFMVAGVCHEMTNPLTSLHSIVQILKSEEHIGEELLGKGLDNISINVKRLLEISRRLVKFSRVGDEPRLRFAIDDAVDEALSVLELEGALRDVEVIHLRCRDAIVHGIIGQVGEIFLNLCINGIQAMGARGRLKVETRIVGPLLEVVVTDSGPGVAPDVVSRIFDPFFTTKSASQGTGLGLSISAELAREHGGAIELRHSSPDGASFCVTFPREAT